MRGQHLVDRAAAAVFRRRPELATPEGRRKLAAGAQAHLSAFRDDLRFGFQWAARPRSVGAIAPSGRQLARAMAMQVNPELPGAVVELGPGTGVITRALIARGIAEERLILVEFNREFAQLLRKRFPGARVLEGDAFALARQLRAMDEPPLAAVVSGLPLFNQPMQRRLRLLAQALAVIDPRGAFIQFSYHLLPPVPPEAGDFDLSGTPRVWWNLFPARVWVYRNRAPSRRAGANGGSADRQSA